MNEKKYLEFRGGLFPSFIPMIVFGVGTIVMFVAWQAVDFIAMAMLAFVGLIIGGLFCKDYTRYWEAVVKGISKPISIQVLIILLVVSMFGGLVKSSNISIGLVWLANKVNLSGGGFAVFVFISICIISTATGSSFAGLFTGFPIFYPASVLLGCNPSIMAGLILGGAIFGDNLAPISDTTILSASAQEFKNKSGVADIGGCVATRFKYSLVAFIISATIFYIIAGGYPISEGAKEILAMGITPKPLIMLIPVILTLIISIKTRDIFKSITFGLILGTLLALVSGILTVKDIFYVKDGVPTGFLFNGFNGMVGVVMLIFGVCANMGILEEAGATDAIISKLLNSKIAQTPRGSEFILAMIMTFTCTIMAANQDASLIALGDIFNRVGQNMNLHPYRRANLLDGFANSFPICVPFLSNYIFMTSQLTVGYDFIVPQSAIDVSKGMIYPFMLFLVLLFSIFTGWGRIFEGPNGEMINEKGKIVESRFATNK